MVDLMGEELAAHLIRWHWIADSGGIDTSESAVPLREGVNFANALARCA
jgi:hypothetical protein